MRKAFLTKLSALAADERIVLLTGDLGYTVIEDFASRWPERFYNAGVAEQNMLGMAAGLAEAGFIPFVYSIATFASMRAYEILRNGAILNDLPIRIIAIGQGFDYGPAGATHHALEDLALMRVQPRVRVISPSDDAQSVSALDATWDLRSPVYYRLAKDPSAAIPGLDGRFDASRVEMIRDGSDVLLLATGSLASEAIDAAEILSLQGIEAAVGIVASIKPLPADDLQRVITSYRTVVTIEEHYVHGGFGSAVCELAASAGLGARIVTCGVGDRITGCGSRSHLRALHGLTAGGIAARIQSALSA